MGFCLLCIYFLNFAVARAVEIFLQAILTKSSEYAGSRNAKTLTVGHL